MARSERSTKAERRRNRSTVKLAGRASAGDECSTGHPALFTLAPVLELGRMPQGGGYPVGFVEAAAAMMGADLDELVHLCAGSVQGGRLTIDLRAEVRYLSPHWTPGMRPDVVGDVRWLPLGDGTVSAILADPPYSAEHAAELWQAGKQYPTPAVILEESARALRPGGRVAILHHVVPSPMPGLRTLGVYGVTTGTNYRIRALTVFERTDTATLLDVDHEPVQLAPPGAHPRRIPPGGRVDLVALAGGALEAPLEELEVAELEAIAGPDADTAPGRGALPDPQRPTLIVAAALAELDRR